MLALGSNWEIKQIFPKSAGAYFFPLDPESEFLLPLKASLPFGYHAITDIVKVFGTMGTTNFRWLELPPLDSPVLRKAHAKGPVNPLETLLAAVADEEPKTRSLDVADRK